MKAVTTLLERARILIVSSTHIGVEPVTNQLVNTSLLTPRSLTAQTSKQKSDSHTKPDLSKSFCRILTTRSAGTTTS